jgi:Ca2+-binding RTX toxin-like protein
MAIFNGANALQGVDTKTFPELKNVVNGSKSDADPDGGWHFFDSAEVRFEYPVAATLEIRFFSQANNFGPLAALQLLDGTVSSLSVFRGGAQQWQLTGFTPFEIQALYDDATAGLTTFPAALLNGVDEIIGSQFADILFGFDSADVIMGNEGDDEMNGGENDDNLTGGKGADEQTGGIGADTFFFLALADSTKKPIGRDTLLDFSHSEGDKIDLEEIDARKGDGTANSKFKFIGKQKFGDVDTKNKGELRYKVKNGDTLIQGNIDSDNKVEFAILLDGVIKLQKGDFVL